MYNSQDATINEVALPVSPTTCAAQDYTQSFSVSEPGVSSFTATSSSPTQVTVTPMTSSGAFDAVEPMTNSNNTTTSIVVSDGQGNTASVKVTFNLSCFNGNVLRPHHI